MQKQFLSPLRIPERKLGAFAVRHKKIPKGTRIDIVSVRNALFDGRRPTHTIADRDYWQHELTESGGVWMTDSLQEAEQCRALVQDMRGHVLVGGLGLGLVLQYLPSKVKRVTVVEQAHAVVDLVWQAAHHYGRDQIYIDDIHRFARDVQGQFDFAFLDTWAPTGERALATDVLPLRYALEGQIEQKNIRCWAEAEMWGQVRMALQSLVQVPMLQEHFATHYRNYLDDVVKAPFYKWYEKTKPNETTALKAIENFIAQPLHWEKPTS